MTGCADDIDPRGRRPPGGAGDICRNQGDLGDAGDSSWGVLQKMWVKILGKLSPEQLGRGPNLAQLSAPKKKAA